MRRIVVISAVCAVAGGAHAQGALPEQRLTQPEIEYREGLTRVISVAELPDDRVIVVALDPRGPTLINLRSGTASPIGRRGQGPGEWSNITRAIPLTGDTALLHDSQRRTLLTSVGDHVLGSGTPVRAAGIQQADGQGRIYYLGGGAIANATANTTGQRVPNGVNPMTATAGRRDSVAIMRESLRGGRVDTLGYQRLRESQVTIDVVTPSGPVALTTRIPPSDTDPMAQAPIDLVAVGRDGRVAIVRAPEYRVEWILPDGRRVSGSPVPTASRAGGPPMRSALIASNGELWVERGRRVNDSTPVFDVINAAGALVRTVRLPNRTRLIAFGSGTVYLVRIDQDDLEYLQRFRLP